MADEADKLSPEDEAKLAEWQAEFDRDGPIAVTRLAEKDPALCLKLLALFDPEGLREAIEDAVVDEGWTNADIHEMLEKATRKH
jgi:hypothetical protein